MVGHVATPCFLVSLYKFNFTITVQCLIKSCSSTKLIILWVFKIGVGGDGKEIDILRYSYNDGLMGNCLFLINMKSIHTT